jgi:hypothetical protein
VGAAALNNQVDRSPIVRALLQDLDAWVVDGIPAPASRIPHISDGTLAPTEKAGWPTTPGVHFPVPYLKTYRLDFGPDWQNGIVSNEPPKIGKPFVGLLPAVDPNGNSRGGIRLPAIEVPVGTYGGWNFRSPSIGSSDQLFGEIGSLHPFARNKQERIASGDSRLPIGERYAGREEYLSKVAAVAQRLVEERFVLAEDMLDAVNQAVALYDWAVQANR